MTNKNVLVIGGSGSGKTRFYLHCKLKLKANEEYDTYELDVTDADTDKEQEARSGGPPERDETEELSYDPLEPEPDIDEPFDYGAFF